MCSVVEQRSVVVVSRCMVETVKINFIQHDEITIKLQSSDPIQPAQQGKKTHYERTSESTLKIQSNLTKNNNNNSKISKPRPPPRSNPKSKSPSHTATHTQPYNCVRINKLVSCFVYVHACVRVCSTQCTSPLLCVCARKCQKPVALFKIIALFFAQFAKTAPGALLNRLFRSLPAAR